MLPSSWLISWLASQKASWNRGPQKNYGSVCVVLKNSDKLLKLSRNVSAFNAFTL